MTKHQNFSKPEASVLDIFVHIPKTSGSTIRGIISRQYGVESTVYCESDFHFTTNAALTRFLEEELTKKDVKIVTGHHKFGLHEVIKAPCRYFSMMRNPLDRALSNYFYAFSYEDHLFRDQIRAGKLSFEGFLELESKEISNSQSYMLAGPYASKEIDSTAIENIALSFAAVGISERFDESLLYLAKCLRWKPPLYMRKNVTKLDPILRSERERLSELGGEKFDEFLHADTAVYTSAIERMDQWIADQGDAFGKAVAAFKVLQQCLAEREDERIFDEYTFEQDDELPATVVRSIDSEALRTVSDYLQEPLKKNLVPHNYTGYVEAVQGNFVSGWAADICAGIPIYVTVRDGDQEICRLNCTGVREDVVQAGFPMAVVGFVGTVPNATASTRNWSIFYESTALQLSRSDSA